MNAVLSSLVDDAQRRLGARVPRFGVRFAALSVVIYLAAGCSAPPAAAPAAAPPTTAPAPAAQPTTAPAAPAGTTAAAAPAVKAGQLDLNAIFPAGAGRDLVLQNCTSCHTIVPIVTGQKPKGQWEVTKNNHLQRVSGLSKDQVDTIFTYLENNFGPDNPVPQLPQELLNTGTSK
jgi:mono/diheme cytochrome c family protein